MKKQVNSKDAKKARNPLVRFDPDQPAVPPLKAYKRSVYFPEEKIHILSTVNQVIKEIGGVSFNDVVAESLELWLDQTKQEYLEKLCARLKKQLKKKGYHKKTQSAILAIEKELKQLGNAPLERYRCFVNSVLGAMDDYCLPEMTDMVHTGERELLYKTIKEEEEKKRKLILKKRRKKYKNG